jgi:TetR/AcrR family transcriptional regulator, lmrAB and yxaGH operons repressor
MPTDTRRRMIVTTSKLLERQGFHGTGLNQILEESGAPKGSMYFHFPGGKNQLAAEAISAAADHIERALRTHEGGTALEAIDGYLVRMTSWLQASGFSGGCPIATTALEVGPTTSELGDACDAAFERLIARVSGWLEADGFDAVKARDRSVLVYSAIEGALIFSKAKRSIEPMERLRADLPRLLGTPDD